MRTLLGLVLGLVACGGDGFVQGSETQITRADPCAVAKANHSLEVDAQTFSMNAQGLEDRSQACDRFLVDVISEVPALIEVTPEAALDVPSCTMIRGHISYHRLSPYESRATWISGVTLIGVPTEAGCELVAESGALLQQISPDGAPAGLRLGITLDLDGQPVPIRVSARPL